MALITVKEIAVILALHRGYVEKIIQGNAGFPTPKRIVPPHNKRLFDEDEVRKWAEKYTRQRQLKKMGPTSTLDNTLTLAFLTGRYDRNSLIKKYQRQRDRSGLCSSKTRCVAIHEQDVQSSRDQNPWAGLI